jgi:hypothetical protein
MTVPLTRHQHLEVCRLRCGRILVLCCTYAPVRWVTGRTSAEWCRRVVWEWPKEGKR